MGKKKFVEEVSAVLSRLPVGSVVTASRTTWYDNKRRGIEKSAKKKLNRAASKLGSEFKRARSDFSKVVKKQWVERNIKEDRPHESYRAQNPYQQDVADGSYEARVSAWRARVAENAITTMFAGSCTVTELQAPCDVVHQQGNQEEDAQLKADLDRHLEARHRCYSDFQVQDIMGLRAENSREAQASVDQKQHTEYESDVNLDRKMGKLAVSCSLIPQQPMCKGNDNEGNNSKKQRRKKGKASKTLQLRFRLRRPEGSITGLLQG